jgi:CheY-like chemotaxis protein
MILFVDDDVRSLRPYCDELEFRGRECRIAGSVDEALRVLRSNTNEIELVVWDMMMPSGKTFAGKDIDGGLRTGEYFYQSMRSLLPDVPAVLFTNRDVGQLAGAFRADPLCECRMKEDLLPSGFADRVESLLRRGSPPRQP